MISFDNLQDIMLVIIGISVIANLVVLMINELRYFLSGEFEIYSATNNLNAAWTMGVMAIFYYAYFVTDYLVITGILTIIGALAASTGFTTDPPSYLKEMMDVEADPFDLLADPQDME